MKIDGGSNESVYITINGWVYYIDDSTGEQIIEKWRKNPVHIQLRRLSNEFE